MSYRTRNRDPIPLDSSYDHAIIIGINHYPDPGLDQLQGAENDAREFHRWVISAEGGAVPEDQAKLILSSDFQAVHNPLQAHPNSDDIETKFLELIGTAIQDVTWKGRRLYIFYSGHGFTSTADHLESALITSRAIANLSLDHFPGNQALKKIIPAGLFQEIVLISDCCRNIFPATLKTFPWNIPEDPDNQTRNLFIAYSTLSGKESKESLIDDEYRGLFTYALIKSLTNAKSLDSNMNSRQLEDMIKNNLADIGSEYIEPYIDTSRGNIIFWEFKGQGVEDVVDKPMLKFIFNQAPVLPLPLEVTDGNFNAVEMMDPVVNGNTVIYRLPKLGYYKIKVNGFSDLIEVNSNEFEIQL